MGKVKAKTEKRATGDRGERKTALYLMLRGYRILERNWTSGHKEVDMIAKRGKTVAFVEVKTRLAPSAAPPQAAVGREKRANIIAASKAYALLHDVSGLTIRYDIAEVTPDGVNYIKSAFDG